MGKVQADALYILRHMLERPYFTSFAVEELAAIVALPKSAFDGADTFLLQSFLVNGSVDSRFVTPQGVAWHDEQMEKRFDLSLLAERVLVAVVTIETEEPRQRRVAGRNHIQTRLDIGDAPYLAAARELADAQLIEELDEKTGFFIIVGSTAQGRNALRRGFRRETPEPNSTVNVGAMIGTMHGGSVQGIGQASQSEITQITNDPQALAEVLDKLEAQLIEAVKGELSAEQLIAYTQKSEELKAELKADKPRPSVVKGLLGTLSFLGDIEGTIELAGRVWQLVGPLVPLALTVLQNAARQG